MCVFVFNADRVGVSQEDEEGEGMSQKIISPKAGPRDLAERVNWLRDVVVSRTCRFITSDSLPTSIGGRFQSDI